MNQVNIQFVLNEMIDYFPKSNTMIGDFSDLGNEIGFIIGKIFSDGNMLSQEEIDNFIIGFKHGVSLTNGTHP